MIPLIFPVAVYLRVVFITAIINLLAFFLIWLSCRCINMWGITSFLTKYRWYSRVFKWHCYLWYILIPSLLLHAVAAISLISFPF